MKIFYLPDLGEGLPDAEIREWYVKEGDEVKVDQPMVAMETAKAVVDVPAPRTGQILKLYGQAGDVIATGAPLIEFTDGGEPAANLPPATAGQKAATVVGSLESSDTVLEEAPMGIVASGHDSTGIKAIPAVRALAKRLKVDLTQIVGTGPNGQISMNDVEQAAAAVESALPASKSTIPPAGFEALRGVRRAMALTMMQAHREVVPVTLVDDANIQAWPAKTDITLRVIRALRTACTVEPALNAWYDHASMSRRLFSEIHLGLAIDSADGLFVPVLKDIGQRSAEELRAQVNLFKEQAKARTLPQEDLKGATLVLSNVGIFAGRYASPIVVPPTVAIIAMGKIREEAGVSEGKVVVQRSLPLSLTIDHRAITGGEAARFLAAVIQDLTLAE